MILKMFTRTGLATLCYLSFQEHLCCHALSLCLPQPPLWVKVGQTNDSHVTWVHGQGSEIFNCSDENMMDPYNIAICFGPTLVPIPTDRDQVRDQHISTRIQLFLIQSFRNNSMLPSGPISKSCQRAYQELHHIPWGLKLIPLCYFKADIHMSLSCHPLPANVSIIKNPQLKKFRVVHQSPYEHHS